MSVSSLLPPGLFRSGTYLSDNWSRHSDVSLIAVGDKLTGLFRLAKIRSASHGSDVSPYTFPISRRGRVMEGTGRKLSPPHFWKVAMSTSSCTVNSRLLHERSGSNLRMYTCFLFIRYVVV